MRLERIAALLALLALAVAMWLDVAAANPIERTMALVVMGLVTLAATPSARRWLDAPRARALAVRSALVVAPIVVVAGLYLGGPRAWDEMGLRGDWPVNEVFVHALRDAIARGRPFTWSTLLAPGDPTTDLYPTLAHRVLAWVSFLAPGIPLHRLVVGAAVLAFVSVAIGVARSSRALGAPWLACLVVGLACLYDYGSDFGWGARATFFWGFFPSTLAMGVWYATLPSALEALRRPRRTRLALVACGFGLAAMLHPVGLVLSGALVVGAIVGVPAGPPRSRTRVLTVLVALAAGLALTAPIWAPASQRVLDHGVHFGTPQVPIETAVGRMAQGIVPDGSFVVLVLLGWIGAARALVTRRAGPALLAIASLFLVSLYIETFFLDLGLAPSVTTARWQSFRVGTFLKPVLYVLAAHALGAGATLVSHTAARRPRWAMRAAGLALALGAWQLGDHEVGPWIEAQSAIRTHDITGHELADREAFLALREHLAAERAAIPGGQHARLLLFCPLDCPYELMELAWDPGVPLLLHHPAPAGHFLRDQFFDTSPENLRRFGVRWAVAVTRTPPPGDESTTRHFGNLMLRDIPGWDGEIAHVVSGEGTVVASVVEGEGFDLDVTGGPVRVELGTPWYPRLVATHDGAVVPIAPLRVRSAPENALDRGERAVVLELPPGRTSVRATGSLSSDGAGRGLFVLALLGLTALGVLVFHDAPRIARARRASLAWLVSPWPARLAWMALLALVSFVPFSGATARGLRFGVLFPRPRMQLELPSHEVVPCEPRSLGRSHRCGDAEVAMTVATVLQDWHVGWPVPVPAIEVRGAPRRATLVIETEAPLEGHYLGACELCSATISRRVGGVEQSAPFAGPGARVLLPTGAGTSTIRAQIHGSIARVALVRADLVIPPEAER
ncbi:MAG: hypothetical protein K1X94_28070 [Sandaracinaceae bacterium]|nr:hypothetical protein [Sandaracinaceae bacterium]